MAVLLTAILVIVGSLSYAAGQGGKFISQVVACPVVAL
jgi:hypothetical protein